jgi:hypothetical protein
MSYKKWMHHRSFLRSSLGNHVAIIYARKLRNPEVVQLLTVCEVSFKHFRWLETEGHRCYDTGIPSVLTEEENTHSHSTYCLKLYKNSFYYL